LISYFWSFFGYFELYELVCGSFKSVNEVFFGVEIA